MENVPENYALKKLEEKIATTQIFLENERYPKVKEIEEYISERCKENKFAFDYIIYIDAKGKKI